MDKVTATDPVANGNVFYNDLYFRLVVSLIAAHRLVMVGKQFGTLEAFTKPSYYPTILINFGIAFIIASTVRFVTIKLDRNYPWYENTLFRTFLQIAFGIVLVSILAFFLVFGYFLAFSQDIFASTYLDYEFPFSVVLIIALNFYYVAYYFAVQYRILRQNSVQQAVINEIKPKEIIVVDLANKSVPARVCDILAVFIWDKTVFIWLAGMKSLGECYGIAGNLTQIEEQLDKRQFFRINRQCLVNFNSISAFSAHGEKGLQLKLEPDFAQMLNGKKDQANKLCQVSTEKVPEFKKWMDR